MRPIPKHAEPQPEETGAHPAWCDLTRCTADPASQADGYRLKAGGEHRSAAITLDLTTALGLPVRHGMAWLSEACAPWLCDVFLRVRVGDVELSVSAADARPVIDALSALLASTDTGEEVNQ